MLGEALRIEKSGQLPKLAWVAELAPGLKTTVTLGEDVEVFNDGIVEGAWSGEFRDFGFANATTFTGSGLRQGTDHVLISTASDSLSPVYVVRTRGALYASNCLSVLLWVLGDSLDPVYPFYDADIMSIIYGIDAHVPAIPTARGQKIGLHYVANLQVDVNLELTCRQKPSPREFVGYDDYVNFLARETALVTENARSAARALRFTLLASISSGYDSPACAVLAKRAGARNALTLRAARGDFDNTDDSGREIGEILGMDVFELDRANYFRQEQEGREVEFLGSGYGGADIVFLGAEQRLAGTMFFTGYHGDKIWDVKASSVSANLRRGDPSGSSLHEFRLRVGFINFAVPFIGARSHSSIYRIAVSDDLSAWRLNNRYDRPIPRRLVEEQGVARQLFGQLKKAVAVPYQKMNAPNPALDDILSAGMHEEFKRHLSAHGIIAAPRDRMWRTSLMKLTSSWKVNAVAQSLGWGKRLDLLRWRYRKPITEHNFVTAWASDQLRKSCDS